MRSSTFQIQSLLDEQGAVARRDHPGLATAMAAMLRTGTLAPVLPGVYAEPESARSFETRVAALRLWDRDAVLLGTAAARTTFWPTVRCETVECAVGSARRRQPGFDFVRRSVSPELVWESDGCRCTFPALTALDLCLTHGGDGIDQALRTRATTLAQLRQVMDVEPGRRGNRQRRRLLLDSRDEPWSAAERHCHRLLRQAGITGWQANRPVLINGRPYYPDVLFERLRLAIEIDGREFHDDPEAFERDRARQNALVLAGWTVLRFTWRMLVDDPDGVVAAVRRAVALASC